MNLLKQMDKKKAIYSFLFAIIMSFIMTLGRSIDFYFTIYKSNIFIFILSFIVSFLLLYTVLSNLAKIQEVVNKAKFITVIEDLFFKPNKKCFRNCMVLMFVLYIPAIIAFFPGVMAHDVLFHVNYFTKHDNIEIHPILYNYIVYSMLVFGAKIKSTTLAIYLYTLIQTTIMISVFSYCIYVMSKYRVSSLIKLFALLYFAFHPINHLMCVNVVKDTLFSGFCLLFILSMTELTCSKEIKKINVFFAVLSAILMFLFRHNGFLAYLLILPFYYLFFKQENKKKVFLFLLIPVLFYFAFSGIKKLNNIQPPPYASYLAIPLQQMGYVRVVERNKLPDDEKTDFRNIVSENNEYNYRPFTVDPIKLDGTKFSGYDVMYDNNLLQHSDFIQKSIKENPSRFIKLYLKWGIKYPKDYINALFLQTYYSWYPFSKWSQADIYGGVSLAYYNIWDNIAGLPIRQYDFLHSVSAIYVSIFKSPVCEKKCPLISMFVSVGMNSCVNMFLFFIIFYKKRFNTVVPVLIIITLFLSVLLGPLSLIRYAYQNFLIIPLMLAFAFSDFKRINE